MLFASAAVLACPCFFVFFLIFYDSRREARRVEIAASPQAPALHLQWGLDGEALGTGADAAAPPPVPVCAVALLSSSSRPCQDPSFRSLITSASSWRCICNDLFTSLCRLPLPDPALPKDKSHVVFSFACLLLPHTAWHTAGPVIACKPQDSSPWERHHGPLPSF